MNLKLKIGILVNDNNIPAWAYLMLEKIYYSHSAEIKLIVKKKPTAEQKNGTMGNLLKNRALLGHSLYRKLDKRFFTPKPDAFALKDVSEFIRCDIIEVETDETQFSERFISDDLERIRLYELDVIIRLGFKILRGGILNIAKYGVWSYHHGDNKVNRGGPAGVWEVLQNSDETGVTLQILTEDLDAGNVLSYSYSATDKLSVAKNLNNFYWKAASLLPRKIDELYNVGENVFFKRVNKSNLLPHFYDRPLFRTPSNFQIINSLLRIAYGKGINFLRNRIILDQWILLFQLNKTEEISRSFFRFKKIIPPKDRFWADPFVIEKNGCYYIFIEELFYSTNKGHISVIFMDKEGNYKKPVKVLERDYHLSYPFLIEDNGKLYMIPESKANNSIEIYECEEFPLKWKFCKTLMRDLSAVDTTVLRKDGTYYMFTNIKENEGASSHDELFLFHSESLLGDSWQPHPQNPIVSDVRSARPAGNLFNFNGNLYRPSQSCSRRYGYGIAINQVEHLDREIYKEKVVQQIEPKWDDNVVGTHTMNHESALTVIDALYKRRRFRN